MFGGEPDHSKRLIKVIPSFIYRDFSIPLTSNLRPASAQKRAREALEDPANKKRRLELETRQRVADSLANGRDQPVPSTESRGSGANGVGNTGASFARRRGNTRKSGTASSVVQTRSSQTGRPEYGQAIKEESPELGLPPARPVSNPREEVVEDGAPAEDHQQILDDVPMQDDLEEEEVPASTLPVAKQTPAERRSPISSSPDGAPSPEPEQRPRRKDLYELSSTPEALRPRPRSRPSKTYARSPKTPKQVQDVDQSPSNPRRDNGTRGQSKSVKHSSTKGPAPASDTPGKGRPIGSKKKLGRGRPKLVTRTVIKEGKHGNVRIPEASPPSKVFDTLHKQSSGDEGSLLEQLQKAASEPQANVSSSTVPDMLPKESSEVDGSLLDKVLSSSPAVYRPPVRFLSHSPTPERSSDEDDEEEDEDQKPASPAKVVSARTAEMDRSSSQCDSTSDSDSDSNIGSGSSPDSSDISDSEDEDEESANDLQEDANDNGTQDLPSSPPVALPQAQHRFSTPVVSSLPSQTLCSQSPPRSSQAVAPKGKRNTSVRVSEVPLPPSRSSMVPPTRHLATSTARRPKYQSFPSLTQQLNSARAAAAAALASTTFDPRSQSLGTLKQASQKNKGNFLDDSEDDEDDSSSSSSSSSGDERPMSKNAGCSLV
jgi:hypothetical protein